jgi:hypothetical protein
MSYKVFVTIEARSNVSDNSPRGLNTLSFDDSVFKFEDRDAARSFAKALASEARGLYEGGEISNSPTPRQERTADLGRAIWQGTWLAGSWLKSRDHEVTRIQGEEVTHRQLVRAYEEYIVMEGALDYWFDQGMAAGKLLKQFVDEEDDASWGQRCREWLRETDYEERIGSGDYELEEKGS